MQAPHIADKPLVSCESALRGLRAARERRWNALYAAPSGVELEMLPLLGGFFTYKLAVVGRWAASEAAAARASGADRERGALDLDPTADAPDAAPAAAVGSGFDARSVDHVFNRGMLAR